MSDQIAPRPAAVVMAGTPAALRHHRHRQASWETVEVHFLRFANWPSDRFQSPPFSCLGRQWTLEISSYLDGDEDSDDVCTFDICLCHKSTGSIELEFEFSIREKDGERFSLPPWNGMKHEFGPSGSEIDLSAEGNVSGADSWTEYFGKSSNILYALVDGALIVKVRMKQARDTPVPPFVPGNPLCENILRRFNDEDTADVVFEVCGGSELGRGARKKAKTAPTPFYAHRVILEDSASTLAEYAKSAQGLSPIQITDVKPEIFHHMLHYVYGGDVRVWADNAKDLIDAADKYGVVNLKLHAEAGYARNIELTFDNVIDNLLYADAKNCLLLKEVVMDFIVDSGKDILGKVSFPAMVPGSLLEEFLVAVARGKEKDGDDEDYKTMRVSALREKLHEKGLDIDGSRESMIDLLKENSSESSL